VLSEYILNIENVENPWTVGVYPYPDGELKALPSPLAAGRGLIDPTPHIQK